MIYLTSTAINSSSGASNIQSSEVPSEDDDVLHVCSGLKASAAGLQTPQHYVSQTLAIVLPRRLSNAPFPGYGRDGRDIFTGAPFPQLQRAHPQPDIFLQAPFCRMNDLSGPQHVVRCSNGKEPILPHPAVHSQSGFRIAPRLQCPSSPIAAPPRVSSVGQQAAVSSVPCRPTSFLDGRLSRA